MLKVGLTGSIASGKSTVGAMFVALGAHRIDADLLALELMQPGQPVYHQVVEHFGPSILNDDSTIHRGRLAALAFGAPSRVQELNRIVHPAVIRRQEEWMDELGRNDPQAVAIVEAALIFEAGAAKGFDRMVVVTCEEGQRAERFAQRIHLDLATARQEVQRRLAAQLPDAEKIKLADFVIDNSGSLSSTNQQVAEIFQKLRALATPPR